MFILIHLYKAKVPIGSGEKFPDPTKTVRIRIRNPGYSGMNTLMVFLANPQCVSYVISEEVMQWYGNMRNDIQIDMKNSKRKNSLYTKEKSMR